MKTTRFVILLLLVCFVCGLTLGGGAVAMADGEAYYMVEQGKTVTFYYREYDNTAQFVLPYGYTFSSKGQMITSTNNLKVTFNGIDGYIDKAQLPNVPSEAKVDLPAVTVTVDDNTAYRFVGGNREHQELLAQDVLTYLGTYSQGGIEYYAVRKQGDDDFIYFVVKSHTNYAEVESAVHPTSGEEDADGKVIDSNPEQPKKEGFTWMRFVLILGIVIPLITIVIMIVRPRRAAKRARREIADAEDDYEGIDEM